MLVVVPRGFGACQLVAHLGAAAISDPVAVPLTRTVAPCWPLASLTAVPVGVLLVEARARWLECTSGRATAVRAAHLAVAIGWLVAACATALVLGVLAGLEVPLLAFVRNGVAVLGITLLAGRVLGAGSAWILPVTAVLGCWLLGATPPHVPPPGWAVLLHASADLPALGVCGATALAGVAAQLAGGAR